VQLREWLESEAMVVACLCAAWCNTCTEYRSSFDALAARHPDKHFVWIDIEDQADLLGDIDVENFPTLLIQRDAAVAFFGTVLPDPGIADRLISLLAEKSREELLSEVNASAEKREWQAESNLLAKLGR
jgi:thiol-disulfide isomerase/thioredoxin